MKNSISRLTILCSLISFLAIGAAPHQATPQTLSGITYEDLRKAKAFYDDPRPLYRELPYDTFLSPDVLKNLTYDLEVMQHL